MDKEDILKKVTIARSYFNIDKDATLDLFSEVKNITDMSILYIPMSDNISGICIKNKLTPLIAINSSMSLGRQHFSLAHELYHYFFDIKKDTQISSKEIGNGTDDEKCADQFASYFLIPKDDFLKRIKNKKITIKEVIELEQYYKVSRQALLIRLKDENLINDDEKNEMSKNVILSAKNLGYKTDLYKSTNAYGIFGKYIQLVDELNNKNLISNGLFDELLLTGFRDDLVFNNSCGKIDE